MASEILKRDENHVPVIGLVTDDSNQFIKMGRIDDTTKALKVIVVGGSPGTGTVTNVATGTGLTGGPITTTGTIALTTALSPIASLAGNSLKFLRVNAGETAVEYATVSGVGSVTSVSVTTANGVSGVVANPTSTPAITITLGNITPTSIGGTSFTGNNSFSGANAFTSLPTSVATPSGASDLVTKAYVDAFQQGLVVKPSCSVATTVNITLSGEQTIDGVLTSTSRVLVKNQSTQANNGIYNSAAGAWTRATDYDQSSEVQAGTFCAVLAGTTQANTLWAQTTMNPTINVSPLVFTQLSSSGTGTVTSVSVVTANGVSGSVATSTTTPAITLALGDITPSSVNGVTFSGSGSISNSGTTALTAFTGSGTTSGTNTGDQTSVSGNAGTATALQNARTIGGVSFNGTANIVPQTIQSINEATDTTCFPLFISASGSQSLQPLNNASLTFNSNTANLGSTIFNAGTGYQIGGAASSGKILKANGTNFVASTETYAAPGTSGNVMTSDGTNWTSATPAAGGASITVRTDTAFETLTRFTRTNTGAGVTLLGTDGAAMQGSSSGLASGSSKLDFDVIDSGGTSSALAIFSNSPIFTCRFNVSLLGTTSFKGTFYCGIGAPTVASTGITFTPKHTGFKVVQGAGTMALSTTQADGTTEDTTSLATLTLGDTVDVYLKVNSTSSVDYYYSVNGAAWSSATNRTSNMPTGTSTVAFCEVALSSDNNTNANGVDVQSMSYTR